MNIEDLYFMANSYPNVSVALAMNAKVSGSFKNVESLFKKICTLK